MTLPEFFHGDTIPVLICIDHKSASAERHIITFRPNRPSQPLEEVNQVLNFYCPDGLLDFRPLVPMPDFFSCPVSKLLIPLMEHSSSNTQPCAFPHVPQHLVEINRSIVGFLVAVRRVICIRVE